MPSSEFRRVLDRKSTRLNSSHTIISYAVFCLKKKNVRRDIHFPARHSWRARRRARLRSCVGGRGGGRPAGAPHTARGRCSPFGFFFLKIGDPPKVPAVPNTIRSS